MDVENGPALRRAGLDWPEAVTRFWDQTELDDAKPALDLKTELEERVGSIKVKLEGVWIKSVSTVVGDAEAHVSAEETLGRDWSKTVSQGMTDVWDREKWSKMDGRHLGGVTVGSSLENAFKVERLDDLLCRL